MEEDLQNGICQCIRSLYLRLRYYNFETLWFTYAVQNFSNTQICNTIFRCKARTETLDPLILRPQIRTRENCFLLFKTESTNWPFVISLYTYADTQHVQFVHRLRFNQSKNLVYTLFLNLTVFVKSPARFCAGSYLFMFLV